MEKEIKQIIRDIYLIDKGLKMHEEALIKIIQELLRSKPENKIDENFVKELRIKVIERSKSLKLKEVDPQRNMFNILFNKRFAYAFVGTALLACVVIVSIILLDKGEGGLAIKETIKDIGENAFGEIYFAQEGQKDGQILGIGGGGQVGVIAPDAVNYVYTYNGEDFEISNDQVIVYRRSEGDSLSSSLGSLLTNVDLDLIDFSSFENTKINSIEISEDQEFGYSIHISSRQNTLSINANWEKWPRDSSDQQGEELADEEAISIADRFFSDYGINMDMYEQGEVMNTRNGGVFHENVMVVYPLKIDGQIVYDQGGQKYGVYVAVSSFHKRVTSANNIAVNIFESSGYNVAIDKDEAIVLAEQGGMFKNYTNPDAEKTVTIELGTPEIKLVKIWKVSEDKSSTQELFVPSLVFPVLEIPEGLYFYANNVVIPLVGDITE